MGHYTSLFSKSEHIFTDQLFPTYRATDALRDSGRLQKYYGPRSAFLILERKFSNRLGAHTATQSGFTVTFHKRFMTTAIA